MITFLSDKRHTSSTYSPKHPMILPSFGRMNIYKGRGTFYRFSRHSLYLSLTRESDECSIGQKSIPYASFIREINYYSSVDADRQIRKCWRKQIVLLRIILLNRKILRTAKGQFFNRDHYTDEFFIFFLLDYHFGI